MCKLTTTAAIVLSASLAAHAAEQMRGFETVVEKPEITDEILLNQGMGLFFMPGLKGDFDKHWYMDIVSVAYFRVDWSQLEPEEGAYGFDEAFGPAFQYWLSRGKRVAFRIMSSNMHSRREYVSPKWLFDVGVPGVEHKGLYVPRQIDPPFWHPRYMEKQAAFIRALGKRYDGMKGLEFVDLGPVGEWGESHLSRWSSGDKANTGYTPLAYTRAYMRFIDLYREAFPTTPLALNCWTGAGHNDVIVDYAVSKGIWLRQDGLHPNYPRATASRYYHQYFRRVKTLFELRLGYHSMAEQDMTAIDTFKRGLEDPISYLNLMGAWEINKLPEVNRQACRHVARYVGYRLAPVEVERQKAIHVDEKIQPRLWLKITWQNLGAAPCYEHLAIEVVLASEKGEEILRAVHMPDEPTTRWMPKDTVATPMSFTLPRRLAAGSYVLKIGLVDPLNDERHILLPLKSRDDRGRYTLLKIPAEPRTEPLPQPQIPGGDFESEKSLQGWWFPKGIKAALVPKDAPQRGHCLRIEGNTGKGWNYGGAPSVPMLPGAEYRLTAKMNVIAIDDPNTPPFVKIGLVDTEGKWFHNEGSSRYDTTKLGAWQALKAQFITPAKTGAGHFAIEKGSTPPRDAIILLDDARLELLSAP